MTKAGKNSTPPRARGIERRSRLFYTIGSCFVGAIFVFFALFLVRHYVQNGLWSKHYYKDARVFANECAARFSRSDDQTDSGLASLPFRSLEAVPHPRGFFSSWLPDGASGRFYHLEYRCVVPTAGVSIGRGINYMHLGWLFGEDIQVYVNDRQLLHMKGEDFVSFPIAHSDLSVPELTVRITVTSTDGHRIGLVSILPPAISSDTKTHTNLLGIQPIFELSNGVVPLVPSLCFGLLLAFAWITGVRTRIMFTGMFYFVAKIIDSSLLLIAPYLPLAATRIHSLALPLDYLTDVAVFCILLEVFGVWRTRIYSLMNVGVAFSLAAAVVVLSWDGVFPYSRLVGKYIDLVMATMSLAVVVAGWHMRLRTSDIQRRYLMNAALVFAVAYFWRFVNELTRHYDWGGYVNINFYFNFLIPLYLTGIVLYHLSAVELELRQAVREREVMKGRLQVGAELFAVVQASSVRNQRIASIEVRWTAAQPLGLWTYTWEGPEGSAFLCFGKFIGGDEHAALGTAALASLFLQWKEQAKGDGADCMKQINHVLFTTFRGYVRTSVTVVQILPAEVNVWSAGYAVDGLVLQIDRERHAMRSSSQLSGASGVAPAEHTKAPYSVGADVSVVVDNRPAAVLVTHPEAA